MGCWPAARILLGALAGGKRQQFDERIVRVMGTLGDEAYRYHHPYLLAAGVRGSEGTPARPAQPPIQRAAGSVGG
jgi:hypothetical protein